MTDPNTIQTVEVDRNVLYGGPEAVHFDTDSLGCLIIDLLKENKEKIAFVSDLIFRYNLHYKFL